MTFHFRDVLSNSRDVYIHVILRLKMDSESGFCAVGARREMYYSYSTGSPLLDRLFRRNKTGIDFTNFAHKTNAFFSFFIFLLFGYSQEHLLS